MADIHTLVDRAGDPFRVMVFAPASVQRRDVRIIILPGANCDAARYRWLAEPLAKQGATVLIPDPPLLKHPSPIDPKTKTEAAYVTVDQLIRTLEMPMENEADSGLTYVVGHSLGGAILLEYLDPAQAMMDPRSGVGAGYTPPVTLDGGVVIGASLQADVMNITIPWRQNDTPLAKPVGFPLLFLCGENDHISVPETVATTVARYQAPVAMVTQKGANHFGWTTGVGERDLRNLDGKASLSPESQKDNTIRYVVSFLSVIEDRKITALESALVDIANGTDEVKVR